MSNNKTAILIFSMSLMLGNMTHAQSTFTQKLLQPVIEYECKQELESSKTWKVAIFLMSSENQTKVEKNVCQCVGKHAMDDMSAKDVLKASLDETAKNKLIAQAVSNSLKSCVAEFIK